MGQSGMSREVEGDVVRLSEIETGVDRLRGVEMDVDSLGEVEMGGYHLTGAE